jgi:hypothetical protein
VIFTFLLVVGMFVPPIFSDVSQLLF